MIASRPESRLSVRTDVIMQQIVRNWDTKSSGMLEKSGVSEIA